MKRRLFLTFSGVLLVGVLLVALVVVAIRTGLQRYSDQAIERFPGDRVEALIQLAGCGRCSLQDRNHAIYALGQMSDPRALAPLRRLYDGDSCTHETRLCQHELRKAIRMIETAGERTGPLSRLVGNWRRPWRN
jgi:hypothetical protein